MATGWAGEGAVQEQIDATVKDAIDRAKSRLSQGPSLSLNDGAYLTHPCGSEWVDPGVEASDRMPARTPFRSISSITLLRVQAT